MIDPIRLEIIRGAIRAAQAEMDARSFARALGRTFDADQTAQIVASQHKGYRYTFLVAGMRNKTFIAAVRTVYGEAAAAKVAETATALS